MSNGSKVLRDCYLKIKKALAIRGLGSFMKNFGTSKVEPFFLKSNKGYYFLTTITLQGA